MFNFDHIKTLQKHQVNPSGIIGNIMSSTGGGGGGGFMQAASSLIGGGKGGGLLAGASPSPWGLVGAAADTIGGFLPLLPEYSGDKGAITEGLDKAYDKLSDAAMMIPGIGTAIGAGMKAAGVLNKGMKLLGAGTDGMCVCAGTKVFTSTGVIKNIEDLAKEDGIIGWNTEKLCVAVQNIHNVITTSIKECVKITFGFNHYLSCSIDHPIYKLSDKWGFTQALNLKVDETIGVAPYKNLTLLGYSDIDNYCTTENVIPFKITSIEFIGKLIVYNLQADFDHTYLANGIITHNTTTDAILGSNFGGPIGWVNGWTGLNADTMSINYETLAKVGSSYSGATDTITDAEHYSGKKYGGLSLHAMREANAKMHQAGRLLNLLTTMANLQDMAKNVVANQSGIAAAGYANLINGGYDLASVRAAKRGMKLFTDTLRKKTELILAKHKQGGTVEYTPFLFDLTIDKLLSGGEIEKKDSTHLDAETLYSALQFINSLTTEEQNNWYNNLMDASLKEEFNKGAKVKHSSSFPLEISSKAKNDLTPEESLELKRENEAKIKAARLKLSEESKAIEDSFRRQEGSEQDPTVEALNLMYSTIDNSSKDAKDTVYQVGGEYEIDGRILKCRGYENGEPWFTDEDGAKIVLKNGGHIPFMRDGSKMNVIPEGSLHAYKHNLFEANPDLDGQITKKGIPVVVEKENGEIELQAEIERNEIIFTSEVTKQIEDAYKEYKAEETSLERKDELAIQIGNLLSKEIIENTDDRTGLLNTVN